MRGLPVSMGGYWHTPRPPGTGKPTTRAVPTATTPRRIAVTASAADFPTPSAWPSTSATWSSRSTTCLHQRTKSPAESSAPFCSAAVSTAPATRPAPTGDRPCEAEVGLAGALHAVAALVGLHPDPHLDGGGERRGDRAGGHPRHRPDVPARLVDQRGHTAARSAGLQAVPDAVPQAFGDEQIGLAPEPGQPLAVGGDGSPSGSRARRAAARIRSKARASEWVVARDLRRSPRSPGQPGVPLRPPGVRLPVGAAVQGWARSALRSAASSGSSAPRRPAPAPARRRARDAGARAAPMRGRGGPGVRWSMCLASRSRPSAATGAGKSAARAGPPSGPR